MFLSGRRLGLLWLHWSGFDLWHGRLFNDISEIDNGWLLFVTVAILRAALHGDTAALLQLDGFGESQSTGGNCQDGLKHFAFRGMIEFFSFDLIKI